MSWFSLGLLPVFQVSLATLTFILSYVWSVTRNDVSPAFPFISDTGASRPESCFFSQMLNMSAFITFFIMYTRFRYVKLKINLTNDGEGPKWLPRVNLVSTIFGIIAAFGVSLVANFQDNSDLYLVHFIGAFLAFGLGVLYSILQTAVSYRLEGLAICRWRLVICVLCVAAGVAMAASWITANILWSSGPHTGEKQWWKRNDAGYTAHICSTALEWLLALGFFLFFLTYVKEFDTIEPEIIFRPLVLHDRSRGNSGGLENGREMSRSEQSINSLYRQENAEPGERTGLLGARKWRE
ncbi:hypothetical protein RRG08_017607 [Elysia crispata]|uniref:CWH43-like N-terminal domain-containing protein n=1 Tax=Elysia crispata TaxID=231223 RepID=A0AAE0YYP1_9GAST|nr:hypothetical protein RRG08_017607 [Elysia crispata]